MLITFSGLDGAGKTTLIERLRAGLGERGRCVAVRHMNDDIGVYACLRAIRDAVWHAPGGGRNGRPARPATGTPSRARRVRDAIIWNKAWRHVLYLVDLGLFLGYRLYLERVRGQILIMDRYFYDTLVDVADGRHWWLLRQLARLAPTPDLPVFLDTGPEEAFRRKREYPLAYQRTRWTAYQQVRPWVRAAVTVSNADLQAASATLQRLVMDRIGGAA